MPPDLDDRVRQAAAIPLRRAAARSAEMCLIRREDSERWGIPKGFIDPGDTPEGAALNEAFEEAGVRGRIAGGRLGTYVYEKRGVLLLVAVYVMEVTEVRATWPEMTWRERRWCAVEDAALLLADHPVRPLLDELTSIDD